MPRPKKPVELQEGPQAFKNFRRLAQRLVQPRRDVLDSETTEETAIVVEETVTDTGRKRPMRRKSK